MAFFFLAIASFPQAEAHGQGRAQALEDIFWRSRRIDDHEPGRLSPRQFQVTLTHLAVKGEGGVDLAQHLIGSAPEKVYATRLPMQGDHVMSDDNAIISLDFADGSRCSILYLLKGIVSS